jgi:DNA-nicking Smr family endonuclease
VNEEDSPVALPVDGTLDLHTFRPADAGALVADYLDACRERGIFEVRIIHGKGKGILRERVHAILKRRRDVRSFRLDHGEAGGWGATIVTLKPVGIKE